MRQKFRDIKSVKTECACKKCLKDCSLKSKPRKETFEEATRKNFFYWADRNL